MTEKEIELVKLDQLKEIKEELKKIRLSADKSLSAAEETHLYLALLVRAIQGGTDANDKEFWSEIEDRFGLHPGSKGFLECIQPAE